MSVSPLTTPRVNLPEFTVSELAQLLKRTVEENFSHVRVRGEISSFKRHSSGHLYFSLKDADAVLDAVAWRGTRLAIKPEDGMEVVCSGRLTTYPGRSRYQIVVESMELAGVGALLKMLEERKARLAAEGLFAEARKKPLPFLPEVIGVITSPTGAVIRDILHRLGDRFPRRVLLWPVAVQGESAAAQVAAAIEGFNRLAPGSVVPRPDLLIVARGGGSLEDLMAFNEEIVVRAAAASAIPLISAVGHETDTTLIDFASDRRAPTPTAAAEMAVPVRLELLTEIEAKGLRLGKAGARQITLHATELRAAARGLPDPRNLLVAAAQRVDDWDDRLRLALQRRTELGRQNLAALSRRLAPAVLTAQIERAREKLLELPPRAESAFTRLVRAASEALASRAGRLLNWQQAQQKVLERGYVRVRDAAGKVLINAAAVAPGAALALEFHDGSVAVTAQGAARKPKKHDDQGSLL